MATAKNAIKNVNYDPKSPIGKIFGRLSAANEQPVEKSKLYKNVGAKSPHTLLAWVIIHGNRSGLWTVKNEAETVSLKLKAAKKSAKKATKKAVETPTVSKAFESPAAS